MDEPGIHHSRQTDTRTENQAPHVPTHRWVLNTWTPGGKHHTLGSVHGEIGEGRRRVGSWGEIAVGEIPNVDDGAIDAANHYPRTCIPIYLHDLHMYPRT